MRALELLTVCAVLVAMVSCNQIVWSGYTWNIRNQGSSGPGPNIWSDQNVFVDSNGDLHLKIVQDSTGTWTCAQLFTTVNFTYATFEWWVIGRIDLYDKNIVAGLFLYPSGTAGVPDGTNQIDIEFAQWSNASNPRLFYTLFPSSTAKSVISKGANMTLTGGDYTTHRFKWSSKSITYQSLYGHRSDNVNQFATWTTPKTYANYIPSIPLVVHINLWLFQGSAPSNGQPAELVIRKFSKY